MQKLLLATTNKGKIYEIGMFLKDLPVKIVSLKDVGIDVDVVEDRNTYEENSVKKALEYSRLSGLPSISDDGGLEIHALGGAPGVKSHRWFGDGLTDEDFIRYMQKVADELPTEDRAAKFVTVVTFALPSGKTWSERSEVKGVIAQSPHPKLLHGYPYRSFFLIPELRKYYHETELTPEEMEGYNHRWKAVKKLIPVIKKELSLRTK